MSNRYHKKVSMLLILSGIVLVCLNLFGFGVGVRVIDKNYVKSHDAIPGYSYQISEISKLRNMLEKPMPHYD